VGRGVGSWHDHEGGVWQRTWEVARGFFDFSLLYRGVFFVSLFLVRGDGRTGKQPSRVEI
jgi:hypothetical protein